MSDAGTQPVKVVVNVMYAAEYAPPAVEPVSALAAGRDYPCTCDSQTGMGEGGRLCRCDAKAGTGAAGSIS